MVRERIYYRKFSVGIIVLCIESVGGKSPADFFVCYKTFFSFLFFDFYFNFIADFFYFQISLPNCIKPNKLDN